MNQKALLLVNFVVCLKGETIGKANAADEVKKINSWGARNEGNTHKTVTKAKPDEQHLEKVKPCNPTIKNSVPIIMLCFYSL